MAESAPPQPLDVARAFVQTYYQTLAEDANKMPAFYVSDATMSHCDDPKAVGTEAIAAKHCELARAIPNCCVEIDHIMCNQYDIFIIVTLWGFLGPKDGMSKKFVQTFTLKCIGDNRYALAGDLFSYANKRPSTAESAPRPAATEIGSAASSAPAKAPPTQRAVPAPAAAPASASAAEVKKNKVESKPQAPAKEEVVVKDVQAPQAPAVSPQKAQESAPKPAEAKPKVEQVVAEPTVVSLDPGRKKTFAELCGSKPSERVPAATISPTAAPSASSAPKSKPQAAGNKPVASKDVQPTKGERPPRQRSSENSSSSRTEGNKVDPRGVFASRVPAEATEADIRAAFEPFGPISDLKIKTRENSFTLAFISYESAESAQAALKAESIAICGTDAQISELKDKPIHSRGRSNGGRGGRSTRGGGQRGPRTERTGSQQAQKR